MEGSRANLSCSALEELTPSDEELCARSGPEEDSGTCSSEEELEVCSESEETVPSASDELSGSRPGFTPVTPVEESESLPQLAQKNPITDRQLKRINLRIFILSPFPIKIFFFFGSVIIYSKKLWTKCKNRMHTAPGF
jgi:hypothetical protein